MQLTCPLFHPGSPFFKHRQPSEIKEAASHWCQWISSLFLFNLFRTPFHSTPKYDSHDVLALPVVMLQCSNYLKLTLNSLVRWPLLETTPLNLHPPPALLFVHSGPFPRAVTSPWLPSLFKIPFKIHNQKNVLMDTEVIQDTHTIGN